MMSHPGQEALAVSLRRLLYWSYHGFWRAVTKAQRALTTGTPGMPVHKGQGFP